MDSTHDSSGTSHFSSKPVVKAGCVTPFFFADGSAGYCVYDSEGTRIGKEPLPSGKTVMDMARLGGVKLSKHPPKPSKK